MNQHGHGHGPGPSGQPGAAQPHNIAPGQPVWGPQPRPPRLDPAAEFFGHADPVALQTRWGPLQAGGIGGLNAHRLVRVNPHRVEFRPSLGVKVAALALVGGGLVVMLFPVFTWSMPTLPALALLACLSLVLTIAGVLLWRHVDTPRVFDASVGCFWVGARPKPGDNAREGWVGLADIHALQIVEKEAVPFGSRENQVGDNHTFELNLVTRDGGRVGVLVDGAAPRRAAGTLGEFLGVPVWDASAIGKGRQPGR